MKTQLPGKDSPLEDTIEVMGKKLQDLGINIEISSWLNPVPHVWSVHIRDKDCPMCFTNGKGSTKDAALASAYGEYFERISCNYFYADWYFGKEIAESTFVHYPNERWFKVTDEAIPQGLLDKDLLHFYNSDGELKASNLIDTNSGNQDRGICALPFIRQSDQKEVFIPMNIVGNLYVSNGMSAGNTKYEARVQCLSEIFERAAKNKIITEEIALPDIPMSILQKFPKILEGVQKLQAEGFPVLLKDASLGGRFPVINVTLMNPKNGGVFASFGAHPRFEVALERTLTELLQGRSLDTLDVVQKPTFNEYAVCNHDNIEDHFIDSTGVLSWKFFNAKSPYEFVNWDYSGTTQEEYDHLMKIFKHMEKEVYIADYEHLGVNACRILVPSVSEIYLPEDLVWDNNNRALDFREDILNLHTLGDKDLRAMLKRFEEYEHDDYMSISELIGVVFDDGTAWKNLTIGEVKCLSFLALKEFEAAKGYVEMYVGFDEKDSDRMNYYRALETALEITLNEDLNFLDYEKNMQLLYSEQTVQDVRKTLSGELRFYKLKATDSNLRGLSMHNKLLESFHKLRKRMPS